MEEAWRIGAMTHMDPKKYPKRPEQLWDRDAPDQDVDYMVNLARMWASNGKTFNFTRH